MHDRSALAHSPVACSLCIRRAFQLRLSAISLQDDKFELFISSTEINYCYYRETQRVLGNTFGMLVLQDFEAVTPNVLARTIETVEGGGTVVLLLKSMSSLKQLYTMSMDAHARFRTEAHADVTPRFNERFILSLAGCASCLVSAAYASSLAAPPVSARTQWCRIATLIRTWQVLDDELNVLPISSHARTITPLDPVSNGDGDGDGDGNAVSLNGVSRAGVPDSSELNALKLSLKDTQPIGSIIAKVRTVDQVGPGTIGWGVGGFEAAWAGHGGARCSVEKNGEMESYAVASLTRAAHDAADPISC